MKRLDSSVKAVTETAKNKNKQQVIINQSDPADLSEIKHELSEIKQALREIASLVKEAKNGQ